MRLHGVFCGRAHAQCYARLARAATVYTSPKDPTPVDNARLSSNALLTAALERPELAKSVANFGHVARGAVRRGCACSRGLCVCPAFGYALVVCDVLFYVIRRVISVCA